MRPLFFILFFIFLFYILQFFIFIFIFIYFLSRIKKGPEKQQESWDFETNAANQNSGNDTAS